MRRRTDAIRNQCAIAQPLNHKGPASQTAPVRVHATAPYSTERRQAHVTAVRLAAERVPASAVLLHVYFAASEALVEDVMRGGTAWTRLGLEVAH
jgi:hypothetical protein